MSWQKEFPHYDDVLTVPPGFTDTSWGNDVCPRFEDSSKGLVLWCDYKNPELRELGGEQFRLLKGEEQLLNTNDFQHMLGFIKALSFDPSYAVRWDHVSTESVVKELLGRFPTELKMHLGLLEICSRLKVRERAWLDVELTKIPAGGLKLSKQFGMPDKFLKKFSKVVYVDDPNVCEQLAD